ncbi:MAG: ribosome-associated translation inhibitor RaiA [bacterium]
MNVSVTARHFELTPDLKSHAESRIRKLSRFQEGLIKATVVLEIEKYRHLAEISVHGNQGDYAGKATADSLATAIDQACEKVEKQIRRSARLSNNHRNGEGKEMLTMGDVRIESQRVPREMMTLEEATGRLDDGAEVVVFADTDNGSTRVVYRRPDGSMKLIELAD